MQGFFKLLLVLVYKDGQEAQVISSKYDVKLLELAPETNNIEKEKRILLEY